jgi:uridine kinase
VTAQKATRKRIIESNGTSSSVSWRRVVGDIARKRSAVAPDRAMLVGISGIDASGKGYFAARIADQLRMKELEVAVIGADDWLNLQDVCINRDNYAEHFYEHSMRFDEMFQQLIVPLKQNRKLSLLADCADPKATAYRKHRYNFRKIDIVLLEGIFLFKPVYRQHFDLTVWIDCSFECALERAMERAQEGLPPAETIQAFETIYFPAQRIHLVRDKPREAADIVLTNDNR